MKNIIIVTNEPSIADRYLSDIYLSPKFYVPNVLDNVDTFDEDIIASWNEDNGENVSRRAIFKPDNDLYNIYRVPMAGLAYMIVYNRVNNLVDDRNIVVSINENIPTMLYSTEKYDMFLGGKFLPTVEIFEECFDINDSNTLLKSEYDFIVDLVKSNSLLFVSDFINDLLANT